jgi:hypothetical protein
MLKALIVSLPITIVGNGLFFFVVNCFNTGKTLTNLSLMPITAAISFFVNHPAVWGDRDINRKTGGRRWFYKEACFHFVSQLSFAVLVGELGASDVYVKVGTLAVLAFPAYALANCWIFAEPERSQTA